MSAAPSPAEAVRSIDAALAEDPSPAVHDALLGARAALAALSLPPEAVDGPFVVRPLSASKGKDLALCLRTPGDPVVAVLPGAAKFDRRSARDLAVFEAIASALNTSPDAAAIARLADPVHAFEAFDRVADLRDRWNVAGIRFVWAVWREGEEPEPAMVVSFDQGGWVDPYERVYPIATRNPADPRDVAILGDVAAPTGGNP